MTSPVGTLPGNPFSRHIVPTQVVLLPAQKMQPARQPDLTLLLSFQPRLKLTRYLREGALASGIEIINTIVAPFTYWVA
jgi:hypothetical protein